MKDSIGNRRLWRCLGVDGDELVFVSPEGKRFGARVDDGRLDGECERWLRRIPSRHASGHRMRVPSEWYRKSNPTEDKKLLGVEVVKPDGGVVTLEFFRGLPPESLVVDFNLGSVEQAREEIESWTWETGTSPSFLAGLMSRSRRVRDRLSRRG